MHQGATHPSAAAKNVPSYSALIRTFNSEKSLPPVLASLNAQTRPPCGFVFVDSGSADGTLARVPEGAVVHRYVGPEFNFAESLNQGIRFITTEYVLIISSHTSLENRGALEYAISLLGSDENLGAAYFADERTNILGHEYVDKNTFDGFNGLWNTCALVRTSLLRERPFRPEVFSAEDQEWAGWYFSTKGGKIACVSGGGRKCANPRLNAVTKKVNEYVAVAYFANRKLLGWGNILRLFWCAMKSGHGMMPYGRRYYLLVATRLAACHFWKPRYRSRYF
ncbi:MAG: glycosyltransferase family A protein [Verrucomicrobiia bacterium]